MEEEAGQEDLLAQEDTEGRVELLGREVTEGWESVRSGGSTARDIIIRAVTVHLFGSVVIILPLSILTNFKRLMTLISHVAKEEKVIFYYNITILHQ